MEYVPVVLVLALVVGVRLTMSWARAREQLDVERPARELVNRGRRLDASAIAEIPESSVVRVLGEVKRVDRWVVAPISKRPCAYWKLTVSVLEYSPTSRGAYWRTIHDTSDSLPFVLATGADECLVDPALATVSVKAGRIDEIKSSRRIPASYVEHLERAGISIDSFRRTKMRIEESILGFGIKVAVVGAGRVVPRSPDAAAESDYRAPRPTWLCLSGADDELLVSDDRRLLLPRGTGGGVKTEPPRGRESSEPSGTESWASMDVDDFEGRLAARKVLWRIGLAATAVVAIGAIALWPKKETARASNDDDPCDFTALSRQYAAKGAWDVKEKLAYFDTHCTSSMPYRRLHFDVQRTLGNTHAAADDAEQLIETNATDADVWLALAADRRGNSVDLLRQAFALASSDAQHHAAADIMKALEAPDAASRCDYEYARYEIAERAKISAGCMGAGRGQATLSLKPVVISAQIGGATARVTIDRRVGTTIVSAGFAERSGLRSSMAQRTGMTAFDGRLLRGELAIATSFAVGATSTSNLFALVASDLSNNVDAVIGLDYLWRFTESPNGDQVTISERAIVGE